MVLLTMLMFGAIQVMSPDSFGTDGQSFPSTGIVLLILVCGFLFATVGGYVTAVIAKHSQLKHVMALAGLMLAIGVISFMQGYGKQPLWYLLGLILFGLAGALQGGVLATRRRS